jgi:hypothetical protein
LEVVIFGFAIGFFVYAKINWYMRFAIPPKQRDKVDASNYFGVCHSNDR